MHSVVRDEVYRIGYESTPNAYIHSRATHLEIALSYGRDLILRVADDGVGMDPPTAEHGRDGHFRPARNAPTCIPNRRHVP
jgi:signal transduction histidine kinase